MTGARFLWKPAPEIWPYLAKWNRCSLNKHLALSTPKTQPGSRMSRNQRPSSLALDTASAYISSCVSSAGVAWGAFTRASRADQEYKQIVAIKLVNSDLRNENVLVRFRTERQLLANLEHPCIAQLLDGGTAEDGAPYLVMEFVEGQRIDHYCESHHLSLRDRLKLFQQVCEAVQFAHQHLVIHGDIKPGNILVSKTGVPKLLDFGIARLITADCSVEEIGPGKGDEQPMTLRYASPEQIRRGPMGTASDQYSLGVVLYELLTGWYPFRKTMDGTMTKTILADRSPDGPITDWLRRAEMERAILTDEPQKPSLAVVENTGGIKIEKDSQQSLTRSSRELQGDLDCIVLKALSKQPHERYSSVQSLSEDIGCYLNGHPVTCRKASHKYRAGKFARRHVVGVAAAFLLIATIVTATIISLRFAQTAIIQRGEAVDRFNDARKLARFVLFDFDDVVHEGVTPARKRLVAEALGYLNRLSEHTPGDPTFEREIIEGYLKVGNIQGNPNLANLGDSTAARESYTKALQLADALRAKYPRDMGTLLDVARANMRVGDLFSPDTNPIEALKSYRRAQAILETLEATDPNAITSETGRVFERIGTVQLQQSDTKAALNSFRRSMQVAQELLSANPNDPLAHRRLALAYEKVGDVMVIAGTVPEGLEKLNTARSIYQELAVSSPQSLARRDVAIADLKIGDALVRTGKPSEAVQAYRETLRIIEALANEDPKNREYQDDLPITLGRLGDALFASGQRPEAHQMTDRALGALKSRVEAPGATDYEFFQYCWLLVTTPFRDLQVPALARRYAEQLVQSSAGKDINYLDLLARSYYNEGDFSKAVETETKALKLFPPDSSSNWRTEIEKNLATFRARAETKR